MAVTNIALTDEQLARLREHAQASGRSVDEVVREAVDAYLAHLTEPAAPRDAEPAADADEAPWQPTVRTSIDGAQVPIPPAMAPDEVEALLAQPSARARGAFLRAWLLKRSDGVIHEPQPGPPDPAWQARFDDALARIRERVQPEMMPEEIEVLFTEAAKEVRQGYKKPMTAEETRHGTIRRPFRPESQAKIDAALARIQANLPTDLTPEEIDAEIDAAWQEVREERRARRGLHD